MITKINEYVYNCDLCHKSSEIFYNDYLTHIERARQKGWAISRDRQHCYCPECATNIRHIGKDKAIKIWELKHPKEKNL